VATRDGPRLSGRMPRNDLLMWVWRGGCSESAVCLEGAVKARRGVAGREIWLS